MVQERTLETDIIQDALESGREHGFKKLGLAARDALQAVYVPHSTDNTGRASIGTMALPEALAAVKAWLRYYDEIILPARKQGARFLALRNRAGAANNSKEWIIWDTKIAGPYDFVARTREEAELVIDELIIGLESDKTSPHKG